MKMMGQILEYNEVDSLGYIKGFDDMVYLFHQIHVKQNVQLKKGDIVKFDFSLNGENNMPYAMDIEIVE